MTTPACIHMNSYIIVPFTVTWSYSQYYICSPVLLSPT